MSDTPVVRVRFLVALVVLFGVLAVALGGVAVQANRQATDADALVAAQDVVHRTSWPADFVRTGQLDDCNPSARHVCLQSGRGPAETAQAVAEALGLQTGPADPAEPAGRYALQGQIGEHPVQVLIRALADADGPAGSLVDIGLDPTD